MWTSDAGVMSDRVCSREWNLKHLRSLLLWCCWGWMCRKGCLLPWDYWAARLKGQFGESQKDTRKQMEKLGLNLARADRGVECSEYRKSPNHQYNSFGLGPYEVKASQSPTFLGVLHMGELTHHVDDRSFSCYAVPIAAGVDSAASVAE